MHIQSLPSDEERSAPEIGEEGEGELALDIFEDEHCLYFIAPIAGVDEKSVDINITDDVLSISGTRPRPKSLPKAKHHYLEECYWGPFRRNVLLPSAVNSDETKARLEQDILIVEVPKARKAAKKIISLKTKT